MTKEDPYSDDSGVLLNKLGVTDKSLLEQLEYEITGERAATLNKQINKGEYEVTGMDSLKDIHKSLFSDIYDWAGEYRNVNMRKNDHEFMVMNAIKSQATHSYLENKVQNILNSKDSTKKQLSEGLGNILDEVNYLHPFREGNGRTQRLFTAAIAHQKGYDLDFSKSHEEYMEASIKEDKKIMASAIEKGLKKLPGTEIDQAKKRKIQQAKKRHLER